MATFLLFLAMQTSKRGLKTELGREAWLYWPPKSVAAGSPAQHTLPTLPRWHSQAAQRWEHGGPSYSLTRAGQEAPKPRPEMGVFPENLRAELTERAHRPLAWNKFHGKPVHCLPRDSGLSADSSSSETPTPRNNPFEDLLLPSPVKGSCHLN